MAMYRAVENKFVYIINITVMNFRCRRSACKVIPGKISRQRINKAATNRPLLHHYFNLAGFSDIILVAGCDIITFCETKSFFKIFIVTKIFFIYKTGNSAYQGSHLAE